MRAILQRVKQGAVRVDGRTTGAIGTGLVVLVGVTHEDTPTEAERLASKTAHLRIFEDDEGKMNRSTLDMGGGILVVPQFTLYAD
ncbi:MAG TPA: D-tyrosyl-tRNA(Tyr) deacylase, partial [Anaerolineae bacterium]|nr:D-tyrosyl-tRNA(Tyr) deacylase [Anaerolineae bacterium]